MGDYYQGNAARALADLGAHHDADPGPTVHVPLWCIFSGQGVP